MVGNRRRLRVPDSYKRVIDSGYKLVRGHPLAVNLGGGGGGSLVQKKVPQGTGLVRTSAPSPSS